MSGPGITLTLLDGRRCQRIEAIASLVAADASGQFGIQPGHEALVTAVEPGLFRYRLAQGGLWRHGACTGGLLHCLRGGDGVTEVRMVSRRFLQGDEPELLQAQLAAVLAREQTLRVSTLDKVANLDLAFYKRMQQLSQTTP